MRASLAVLGAFLLAPALASGGERVEVGRLSEPGRLVIEGAETFTPGQIKRELASSFDYLLAAHPRAPRVRYLVMLRNRLLAGYRNSGFPEAKVRLSYDEAGGRVVARIEEGPRCRCGKVKVRGAGEVPAQKLIDWLTRPRVPEDLPSFSILFEGAEGKLVPAGEEEQREKKPKPPVWKAGRPAAFGPEAAERLTGHVKQAYAEFGRFFPKFSVRVEPDEGGRTASLVVEVEGEGPRGVIGEIKVTGCRRNSREDVLKFLGIKPGMPFDRAARERARRKLNLCGRLLRARLTTAPPEEKGRGLKVLIHLVELPGLPKLSAKLTEMDEALLRARDWLTAFPSRGQDMIITHGEKDEEGTGTLEAVISPRGGVVVAGRVADGEGRLLLNHVLLADAECFGIYSRKRRRKFVAPALKGQLSLDLRIRHDPKWTGTGSPFMVYFGGAVSPEERAEDEKPVVAGVELEPAAFLHLSRRKDRKCMLEGGKLVVTGSGGFRLEAVAGTGRILDLRWGEEEGKASTSFKLGFSKHALESRVKALQGAAREHRNYYEEGKPVSSLVRLLLDELMDWPLKRGTEEERKRALVAAGKVLTRHVLEPLDALSADKGFRKKGKDDDRFVIPSRVPHTGKASMESMIAELIPRLAVPLVEELFPRYSWPWTLARETSLLFAGRGVYAAAELSRLYASEGTGPVGCWAASELLMRLDRNAARNFARRGLSRLGAEHFRRDVAALLDPRLPLGRCALKLAEHLRGLDEKEVEALAAVMRPGPGKALLGFAAALRAGDDEPRKGIPGAALDVLWSDFIRKPVAEKLRAISGPPPGGGAVKNPY